MILCLDTVLDASALRRIRELLSTARWADGAASAGWNARPVKRNEQVAHDQAANMVLGALERHAVFQSAALPARIRPPMFSRYRSGMHYGRHVDNALMAGTPALRADLALTVFLSPAADYDGGELVIEGHEGERSWKLDAGQALLYPASTLHRVEALRSGERHAAILWVQSLVRDPGQREILFDLDQVRRRLWDGVGGKASAEFDLLNKSYSNLLRAWAEP